MKFQYKYILMAATAAVLSVSTISCDEDSVDPIAGIYEAPTSLKVSGVTLTDKTKEGNIRTFHMALNTAEGTTLNLAIVSNKYYLESTGYTPIEKASARNGNLVSELSTINGSSVVDGTLALAQNGDIYTISNCVLFTADGKSYKLSGGFSYNFEPDDPTALPILSGVQDMGNNQYAVTMSTGGYTAELDMTTYQMVYTGEGNDLKIIFNLPDGKLHPGTYKPGEGYVAGYTFMNNAYEMWGIPAFLDYGGSLWYTVANGAMTTQTVETGDIIVTKEGPLYTILLDQGKGGVFAQYQGTIGDLDPDGEAGTIVQMTSCVGVSNYAQLGWVGLIDLQFANGTVSSSYDAATYTTTYSGSGEFLQIEVYSENGVGTLERGTYTIADDSSFGPMKFKIGAVGMYGDGGTFTKTVTDGVLGEANFITTGSLTIEGEGDATKVTLTTTGADGKDLTYMFVGNLGL